MFVDAGGNVHVLGRGDSQLQAAQPAEGIVCMGSIYEIGGRWVAGGSSQSGNHALVEPHRLSHQKNLNLFAKITPSGPASGRLRMAGK